MTLQVKIKGMQQQEGSSGKEGAEDQANMAQKETFPMPPHNPAIQKMGRPPLPQSNPIDRRESWGVPKFRTGKDLLKGVFNKNQSGLSTLSENGKEPHATSNNPPPTFSGHAVPSDKCFEPLYWPDYFDNKLTVDMKDEKDEDVSFNLYTAGTKGPLVFCVHGAGYTGLTWALVAKKLKDEYQVAALDLRGHGESSSSDDYSADTYASDVFRVWQQQYGNSKPATILLGHSMGGAVAIRAASLGIPSLAALIVIDVVEGTALSSLPYMQAVISKRPTSFETLRDTVEWAFKTGVTSNFEAARVSTPSQFVYDNATNQYVWRTKLEKTAKYWDMWYRGMSEKFLSAPCAKLLLLAGHDRLDKPLTIGQMQGKFQMKILSTGHAIHEDDPSGTAEAISNFASYNNLTTSQ